MQTHPTQNIAPFDRCFRKHRLEHQEAKHHDRVKALEERMAQFREFGEQKVRISIDR
jgi:hypothetical protein